MSNSLISKSKNFKMPEGVKESGQPGVSFDAPITLKALTNRGTQVNTIKKYLKSGWNWNKYSPIIVAEFPEKFRNDPDFKEYRDNNLPLRKILDGDHRKHMFHLTFPDKTKMPAYKIDVASKEEYHHLFYVINWEGRKNASKEEVFVHQVLAREPDALEMKVKLRRCGVSVHGSPDPGGIVGALNSPHVTVNSFKRCLTYGEANVKLAVKMLQECWSEDNHLKAELLEGLTILYSLYPVVSEPNKLKRDFDAFFSLYAQMYGQGEAASLFKDRGGSVHHKHGASITRGIITLWRDSKDIMCTRKYRKGKVQLKVINDFIES
jgi:hypothetical protein